jgi:hypothetical protein
MNTMAHNRLPKSDDLSRSWMVLPSGEDLQNKATPGEELPSPDAVTGIPSDHGNEELHMISIKDRVMWFVSYLRIVALRLADAVHLTPILAYLMPKTFGLPPPHPPANKDSKND